MAPLHLLCILVSAVSTEIINFTGVRVSTEKLSQPELIVKSPYVMTGHTKTIHCISRSGSLPITYALFINKTFVEKRTVLEERGATPNVPVEERTVPEERRATSNVPVEERTVLEERGATSNIIVEERTVPEERGATSNIIVEERTVPEERGATSNIIVEERTVPEERGATFNVTIYNETSLGPYKCKANNSLMQPVYSEELTLTLQEMLSQPELMVKSPNVMTGHTKTIHCISRNGSLPITYKLFINKTFVEKRTVPDERRATSNITVEEGTVPEERGATSNITVEERTVPKERGATFNVTIYNETSLGPYKCRANNSLMQHVYSEELTLTLQVEKNRQGYLEWLIPVLILIGILVIIAYIGIARHKKGRARNQEDQYCAVGPINGREDGSKRCEDQDIEYCSVVLRGPTRAATRTEESVEYMEVSIKRS